MARKVAQKPRGDALQRQVERAGTTIGVNVNMANWSETELAELGPLLRGYVEASLPRKPDAQRAACTSCGEKFGDHPGRRSRFCPECRPQERLRAAREGMRRLRAHRREVKYHTDVPQ